MNTRLLSTLLGLTAGALPFTTTAHDVWIEDTPTGGLIVRFGEFEESLEKSPGALDMLLLPQAWKPSPDAPAEPRKAGAESRAAREERAIREGQVAWFEVKKLTDGFQLTGATPAQSVQAEAGFTVIGKPGDPGKPARRPIFYARWQPAGGGAGQPGLNFDLVPADVPGKVCVYLRGKPLAGAKVSLFAPGTGEQALTSDAAGMVQFSAEKPGLYLLKSSHQREAAPGFFGGKAYDVISHNTSLVWRVGNAAKK